MSTSTTSHPFTDADEIFSGQIASRLDQRDRLINEVLKKLKAAGCRPDPFFDRLSLDETISNAILHGNLQDPSKRVTVRAFSRKDCWGVEVADQGNGFDWKALLKKLRGEPYVSEVIVPRFDRIPPAPPVHDLRQATLAIVTTSGVVRTGNPEGIESWRATKWARYPIGGLHTLSPDEFTCVHGGYDNRHIRANPHRAVPLDVLSQYEKDGRIGRLHGILYSTVGNVMPVERARRLGREVAQELRDAGVHAVLLTAT